MTPTSRLRLIQVGAGGMGRAWLKTVTASEEVQLVGLVDLDVETARVAAHEAGFANLPTAPTLTELITQVEADAVLNITIPEAHVPVSREALAAGLPVLCEKPMAPSVAEGLQLVAAAEASGLLVMISQSRRYFRQLAEFKRLVGELGRIGSLDCTFAKAPHFGGFRDEMEQPLLVDMAIHQFDMARYLLGSDPTSVTCESYNPPWSWYRGDASAIAVFEFADSVRFTYRGTWCTPGLETSWNGAWRVGGEHGSAVWDGDGPPRVEVVDRADVSVRPAPRAPEEIAGSLAEFVAAVRSGTTPQGEVHDNIVSLAMVEAAVTAAAAGGRVSLREVLTGTPR